MQDNGLTAVALWDYEAEEDDEVTFDPGEIITHIEMIDEVTTLFIIYFDPLRIYYFRAGGKERVVAALGYFPPTM